MLILRLIESSQFLSTVGVIFISYTVFLIAKFYNNRLRLPPGPTPLPFLGNFLTLRGVNKHIHQIFIELGAKYNGLFTFYLGNLPQVVVTDKHLGLEVLRKSQFAGRPDLPFTELLFPSGSIDVVLADFSKEWEVLRKVIHTAVKKFAAGDRLPIITARVVDEVIEDIKKTGGMEGKEIDIQRYLYLSLNSILSASAFGKDFTFQDPELLSWMESAEYRAKNNTWFTLGAFVPLLKPFVWRVMKTFRELSEFEQGLVSKSYQQHVDSFNPEKLRDFTDSLIAAKKEAEEEDTTGSGDTIKYLKRENIQNTMIDLFLAGTDTTRITLFWSFLLMATFPEKQETIRKEINREIPGDEIPNQTHRDSCPFTTAFIAEVLRFRNIAPANLPHKAIADVELGGNLIKKDTMISVMTHTFLHDKETWGDPEIFRPERFLTEDGKFNSKPNQFYTPFSTGRRGCPGEKLALADMFYLLARFIQQTKGFEISLPGGPGSVPLDGDMKETGAWTPHSYKILLKKAENIHE